MARPRKTDSPDLSTPINLTVGAIERLTCPPGKLKGFLKDAKVPGHKVRVTKKGAKAFVYERWAFGGNVSITIGPVGAWSIEQAQTEARRLTISFDQGIDPREADRERETARLAQVESARRRELTVKEVWDQYVAAQTRHWGEHHRRDHERLARAGGVKASRGTRGRGITNAGPLHAFMNMRLVDVTEQVVDTWAKNEAQVRPTVARLALRLFHAFLNWTASEKRYGDVVTRIATASREARKELGPPKEKADALLREQLPQWLNAVLAIRNKTTSAYIQALFLTGARPGEMLNLRWEDISESRRSMTIDDKVDNSGRREIPLTPYVAHLISTLPRHNAWVFAGGRVLSMEAANARRRERRSHVDVKPDRPMSEPNTALTRACEKAGVAHVTLHGLRRSYATLVEWLDMPDSAMAQLQGHVPKGSREKNYKVRPLDLLRIYAERIEREFLAWGGIEFVGSTTPAATFAPPQLRVVSGN